MKSFQELATQKESTEFFLLTSSLFKSIDFHGQYGLENLFPQIDAVLKSNGIRFYPWQKQLLRPQPADAPHMGRYRYTNGIIHLDSYEPRE